MLFPHQRLIPALPVLIALLALPCWAQSPGLPQVESMERITVTSAVSRVAEYIDSVPATVSIITRRELERDLAFTFRDMLRYEPGVSIENGAARFGLGNINIRGLDGKRARMGAWRNDLGKKERRYFTANPPPRRSSTVRQTPRTGPKIRRGAAGSLHMRRRARPGRPGRTRRKEGEDASRLDLP